MNTPKDPPQASAVPSPSTADLPQAAVTEFIDLIARLIAQEHHRRMAAKLGNRPAPPNGGRISMI